MKIIGKTQEGFILDASRDELANLLGFYGNYASGCPDWKLGMDIQVSKLYERIHTMRKSEASLADCAKSLRNLADLLEPIDRLVTAALKDPEVPNDAKA
jgi:hypothetical protein